MRNLPGEKAVAIYRQEYAIKPGFAAVAEISPAVGEELFDTGVNMGPAIPALWFQQCLNALNDGGEHYPDTAEDGDIGPGTLAAFRAYRKARGTEADAVMLKAPTALQGADRQHVVTGKIVALLEDVGGRRDFKKKKEG